MNKCSGLCSCPEDDTIFLASDCISSDMYYRLSVGSTGAVFIMKNYYLRFIF